VLKKILKVIAMFLFVHAAGSVTFAFKEIYYTGEFTAFHYSGSQIPILVEFVSAIIILCIAGFLLGKSFKEAFNG